MKTKILKSLTATLNFASGEKFVSEFNNETNSFAFPKDKVSLNHDLEKALKVRSINVDGSVTISYIFSCDYNPQILLVKEGEPLEIRDYCRVYLPKNDLDEQLIIIKLEAQFEELDK